MIPDRRKRLNPASGPYKVAAFATGKESSSWHSLW